MSNACIHQADIERLRQIRSRLFEAIGKSLAEDGHCKGYEGGFTICLPNYFHCQGEKPVSIIHPQVQHPWRLMLDCYVVGPNRHYEWTGPTFSYCLDAASKDIESWIAEAEAERAEQ